MCSISFSQFHIVRKMWTFWKLHQPGVQLPQSQRFEGLSVESGYRCPQPPVINNLRSILRFCCDVVGIQSVIIGEENGFWISRDHQISCSHQLQSSSPSFSSSLSMSSLSSASSCTCRSCMATSSRSTFLLSSIVEVIAVINVST